MLGSLDVVQSCCPSYLLPHSLLFSTVIYGIELAAHPKPCSSCLSSAEGAQSLSAVWLPLIEQLSTLQKPTDKPMSGCQHTLNLLSHLMWFQWRILEARDNSEYGNEQRLQWLEHDFFLSVQNRTLTLLQIQSLQSAGPAQFLITRLPKANQQ